MNRMMLKSLKIWRSLPLGVLLAVAGCSAGEANPVEEPIGSGAMELRRNDCDPDLVCPAVVTCVDGQLYPSSCGPDNCDEPIGKCDDAEDCDPDLVCPAVVTCVDGQLYPSSCGPDNCDEPIGKCDDAQASRKDCNPDLVCPAVVTCVDGRLYPTSCGPDNCDEPIGRCGDALR